VRIFKGSWFSRFAAREHITDNELKEIVNNILETGQADANLGGGVYKLRLARPGQGKSGGYRVIVFYRSGDKTFYVYGFAKSEKDNISDKELRELRKDAKTDLGLTGLQIEARLKKGTLREIL
jgi:hypothetical protein